MRSFKLMAVACVIGASLACGGGSTDAGDLSVQRVAEIAKQIKAKPDQADAILKKAGVSKADFEARLYEIASDPGESAAYTTMVTK